MAPRPDARPGGDLGRLTPAQARTVEAGRELSRRLGRDPTQGEIGKLIGADSSTASRHLQSTVSRHLQAAIAAGVDLGFSLRPRGVNVPGTSRPLTPAQLQALKANGLVRAAEQREAAQLKRALKRSADALERRRRSRRNPPSTRPLSPEDHP